MKSILPSKKIVEIMKKTFRSRFQTKINLVAILSVCLSLILTVSIAHGGINKLYNDSSQEINKGLGTVSEEYLGNYINITSELVETKMQRFFDEQAVAAGIYQTYYDNAEQFKPLTSIINGLPFFQDKLTYNGKWAQNGQDEPTALLVEKYLLDKSNKIKPDVQREIDNSAILDLIMPTVKENGAKKLWVYFEGAKNQEFMRIAPWSEAGKNLDKIYPAFTETPLRDAFNPGQVEQWENKIKNDPTAKSKLSELAIVKSPVQDGGSGKIIMTLSYPIWNKDRDTFKGTICFDVELDEVINYISDLKLGKTGFAFITQENGNVFAVNKDGEKVLGLKSAEDSTVKGKTGAEHNPMLRFLKDSEYDAVKKIGLPKGLDLTQNEIEINGVKYILFQQKLKSLNSWKKEKGFYKEAWTLGFVVPKSELFGTYDKVRNQISLTKSEILSKQITFSLLLIILLAIAIYFFSSKITRDLKKLEYAALEIKYGNYDVDIDIKSDDEIGKLSDTIKKMVQEIKVTFQRLNDQNQLLKKEVEERQSKELIIKHLEEYDTLTNRPKQNVLVSSLKEYIEQDESGTLVIIGIDDFRKVNEAVGHDGGNEILKSISERLGRVVKSNTGLFKMNGDEFVLLFRGVTNIDDIIIEAEQVREVFKPSFFVKGKEIFITSSMGITSYPRDSKDENLLIKFASIALNRAKEGEKDRYQFYDEELNKSNEMRREIVSHLRHAIYKNEFELYYQPQVDLKLNKIIGMEALIRWNSNALGFITPNDFIPLAEELGIINDIGEWVIFTACRQTKKWHDLGYKDLTVSVNVSPIQFSRTNLVSIVSTALNETGLPAENLEIEVTEGLFINDKDKVVDTLFKLRDKGVKFAIDDFGTGYSCLSYLRDLPIDKLKIDRAFIKDIPDNDNGSLATTIIEMGKNFGLRIIAEGVETQEHVKFLLERSCDEAQGFFYSKPINVAKFEEKLKNGI